MKITRQQIGAAIAAVLMLTSVMVSGVAADVTTESSSTTTTTGATAQSLPPAPNVTITNQSIDPTQDEEVMTGYNATGLGVAANNLNVTLYNSSGIIARNNTLQSVKGPAAITIPAGTITASEWVSIKLYDAANNTYLNTNDTAYLSVGSSGGSGFPSAPFIDASDERYDFSTSKETTVYYNATSLVSSSSDLAIKVINSSGTEIATNSSLPTTAGSANVTIPADTVKKPSENLKFQLVNTTGGDTELTNETVLYTHGTAQVVSSSVTANQSIDSANLSKDISFSGGLLQVQLEDGSQSGINKYNLESLGATDNTHFWINFTVTNFTPRVILGSARNADWTVTDLGNNRSTVNISATPANVQYNESKLFNTSRPWSISNTADVSANASVSMAISDMSFQSSSQRNDFNGTMMMTDAQSFGSPTYDATNKTLSLSIAAPSINAQGNQNKGFFDAFLPNTLLNDWGLSSPTKSSFSVQAMGTQTTPASFTKTAEGVRLFIPHHYSEGEITISPSSGPSLSNAKVSDNSGDDIVTDGEQVTVNVNATGAQNVTADLTALGAGSSVSLNNPSGDWWTATVNADGAAAPNDGTYRVTITAEDSGGNTTSVKTGKIDTDFQDPVESQVLNATSNVDVWDRAILPLRTDTSAATYRIQNAIWTVSLDRDGSSFGETSMNKKFIGVYNTGQAIPFTFDDGPAFAETQLANEDVKYIAARLKPDSGVTITDINTFGDLQDLLTQENANSNATFHEISAEQLDSNGDGSASFTPSEPGQYVLIAVSNASNAVQVDSNGNISLNGQTTILGADHALVQRQNSSVSPDQSAYAPGDNVTFSATTGPMLELDANENVTHGIILYDEATLVNESMTIAVNGSLTSESTLSDNVTIEHDIKDVNGVWAIRDTVAFGDTSVAPRRNSGTFAFGEILNFLENETNVGRPKNVATGSTVWNASMTVVNSSANTTVVVETLSSWEDGEYRYVHVATNQNGTEVTTNTGTVTMSAAAAPANLQFSNITFSPASGSTVNTGTTVDVSFDVANTGGQSGTYSAKLLQNGTEVDSTSGSLSAGATASGTLSVDLTTEGTFNLTIIAGDTVQTAYITATFPDTTPPTITLESPGEGDVDYGADIKVNVTDANGVKSTYAMVPGLAAQNLTTASNPRSISTSGITEGEQTITVNATDTNGNTVSETFTFDFVSAPDVDSVTPTKGSTTGMANPWVNATFSDDDHGGDTGINASATTLKIDGNAVDLSSAAVNNATHLNVTTGTLSSGTHLANLTIVDNASHVTTHTWRFTVDATPPSVSISSSRSNVSIKAPTKLSVTANDRSIASASVEVWNTSGKQYTKDITSTAQASAGTIVVSYNGTADDGNLLADGGYKAVINASDTAGNHAQENVSIVVDHTKPAVVGTPQVGNDSMTVGSGSVLTNDTATFLVNASDLTGVSKATYKVVRKSSGSATGVSGTFTANQTKSVDLSSLATGKYQIEVALTDFANNTRTMTLSPTIELDRTAPGLSSEIDQKDSNTLWVNVSASETLNGTPTATITNSSGYSDTVTFIESGKQQSYNGTLTKPAAGAYNITLEGTDLAGNVGTDRSETEFKSVSGSAGSQVTVINNQTGTVMVLNLSKTVNNELVTLSGSDQTAFSLPPGQAADRFAQLEFNNTAIKNVTIGVRVTIDSVVKWIHKDRVVIKYYNVSQGKWIGVQTDYKPSYDIPNYDGKYDQLPYFVAQRDHLSQHAPTAQDTVPPSISYTKPDTANKEYSADTTEVAVDAAIDDAETGVNESSIRLLINGTDKTGASTITAVDSKNYTVDYNVTGLSPGDARNVTIVAEDESGNATVATRIFSVASDTAAPSVTIDDPSEGQTFPVGTSKVSLNVSYSDSESGIDTANVTVSRNGTDLTSAATISGSTLNLTAANLDAGTYNFSVSVPDTAGNTATEVVNFTVAADATGPIINIEDVNGGASLPVGTSSETVTATVNDTGVGVDSTSIKVLYNGIDKTSGASITDLGDGNFSVSYTASNLYPGTENNVTIVAADENGNDNTGTELFNVGPDSTAPTITIDKPTNGSIAKRVSSSGATTNVTIELSFSDGSGIDTTQTQLLFEGSDVTSNATTSSSKVTYTATNLKVGTYTYRLTVKDNSGNKAVKTGTFNIRVESTTSAPIVTGPEEDDDDGGVVTPPSEPQPAQGRTTGNVGSVTVETQGAVTKLTVTDATAGAEVTLDLPTDEVSNNINENGAALNSMKMDFTENASFDADVSFSADKPDTTVPDVAEGKEDQVMGYINVDHTASDGPVGDVTFTFTVTKQKLQDRGVSADDVLLFRYNNNRWTGYETTVVSETSSQYTLEATVPGLSVFAIGTRNQATTSFSVSDAATSTDTAAIAEDFQVTATVTNDGNIEGTFTADLIIDGETVSSQSVTVPAGESKDVSFTWELVESGEHSIEINDVFAGTVTVQEQQTTTQEPTTQEPTTQEPTTTTTKADVTTTPEQPDEGFDPILVVGILAIIALAAGAFILYQRGYF